MDALARSAGMLLRLRVRKRALRCCSCVSVLSDNDAAALASRALAKSAEPNSAARAQRRCVAAGRRRARFGLVRCELGRRVLSTGSVAYPQPSLVLEVLEVDILWPRWVDLSFSNVSLQCMWLLLEYVHSRRRKDC